MLTSYSDDEALFDSITAGASGYCLKDIRGHDLVGAIRSVAAGRSLLDPVATASGAGAVARQPGRRLPNGQPHRAGAAHPGVDR